MNIEKIAHPAVSTLIGVIAHSQLLAHDVRTTRRITKRLPAGFDAVDAAILDWIAASSRRAYAGAAAAGAAFPVH